jgi:hypothetical protein
MMKHINLVRFARMAAIAGLAALAAACQSVSQPPSLSAEARLLAAGYVRQPGYPRPFETSGTYDARYECAPPACSVKGSVSYFTNAGGSYASGRNFEDQFRSERNTSADLRQRLQAAADRRGNGRQYTGVRSISSADRTGFENSSIRRSPQTGEISYTRSRLVAQGGSMRITVSNGETDAQARRGLALGVE